MVRGRRARVHDTAPSVVARAMAGSHIVVDDQFCASPKRKDCKIDEVTKTMKTIRTYGPASAKQLPTVGKMSFDLHGTKTRSKTIKNYFKTDQEQLQQHRQQNDFKTDYINHTINGDCTSSSSSTIELTEDTCDEIFVEYETCPAINGIDKHHTTKLEDDMTALTSTTSNTSGNIFLQEPVLSLNVDKSPNQPSSIKINKTLEVVPIFSPNNNYHLNLNGQFNKIVTLSNNTSLSSSPSSPRRDTLPAGGESNISILLNHDSNSCDSGVVIDNKLELSPSRRRKPTTPHRILCPSPVKHPSIDKSPSSVSLATNYTLMDGTTSSAYFNGLQKKNPKSRRRLNATQSENNSSTKAPQLIGGVILTNETLMKINNTPSSNNSISQKSVLNSAINPTAEQNTNNNYKKRTNGHHQHRERQHKNHNVPNTNNTTNKELTDFFPVRRSVRKTKRAVQEEMMRSIEKAIIEGRDDGLKIEHFEGKGRGVVADRCFKRGEFVVEYIGDLITIAEANQREKKYSLDENAGCYMYYFKHRNQQYCIDATSESGKLGRLVNHSRNGNLITKVVVVKNHPHLVLIAKDDIQSGEELTYDYGDRSKEALLHHPWLAL